MRREVLRLQPGVEVEVELAFGSTYWNEGRGNFPAQYNYRVKRGGVEETLYADPPLHEQIVAVGAGRGAMVAITQQGSGYSKTFSVRLTQEAQQPGIEVKGLPTQPATTPTSPAATGTNTSPSPPPPPPPSPPPPPRPALRPPKLAECAIHFAHALDLARDLWQAAHSEHMPTPTSDVLYKTAFVLYKDASIPLAGGEADPDAGAASSSPAPGDDASPPSMTDNDAPPEADDDLPF